MPPNVSADTDTPISPDLPGSNLSETGQIPQDDATKGWSLYWLAWELLKAFKQTQDGSLVDASIQVYHKAIPYLSNPTSNPTHSAKAYRDLGNAYYERYKRFGRPDDIDSAIQHHQQGVDTDPSSSTSDEKFPALLNQQAMLHVCRFDCTGELLDLTEAIQLCQRAAELTPDGDADKPSWLANLASAFFSRFQRTVDVGDIAQAVQLQARAIGLLPGGHADLPFMLANLGNLYHSQAAITDDIKDVSMAVQCHQEAVELIPDDHPDYASKLSHCGIALCSLFERTQDLEDISQAITLQKKAVDLTPETHVDLPTWIVNLANSFSTRFRRTDDLADLSQAIQLYGRAIAATPDAHGDLPQWMNNLGSAFAARFRRTHDSADIHRSIQQRRKAVELTPEGHAHLADRLKDLGTSYVYHFQHSQDHDALVSAAYNYRLSATCATSHPLVRLTSAMHWARLSPHISPEEVLDAHEQITRLLSLVSGLENTLEHRRWLLLGTSRLSTTAAAAALSVNQPSKALEWLEEGRCIIWGQINQLRTPLDDLRTYDSALADRLEILSKQLDNAPGLRMDSYSLGSAIDSPQINTHDISPIPGHVRLRLVKERDELLVTIRKIPRFENFLQPRKCADLMKSIPDEGIVVVINADETRCDALILIPNRSEPIHIPLERLSYEEAVRLTKALRKNLKSRRVRGEFVEAKEAGSQFRAARSPFTSFQDSLHDILRVLWSDLVEPILDAVPLEVKDRGDGSLMRIWWCPTGPFAFLPIHAAGVYGSNNPDNNKCLADVAISSYIPTLSILERLRSRGGAINIPGNPSSGGILLVSQPDTPGLPSIPLTDEEVRRTLEIFDSRSIQSSCYRSSEATTAVISDALQSYSCVHLACHASQDPKDPLDSAFHLYDGPLRLSEIIRKDLPRAELAFMSACQTSAGDEQLPEEAMHLAAGMLAAGYRSVVGTMWSISDRHAPEVAEDFYRCLLGEADREDREAVGLDVTRSSWALHLAILSLRERLGDSSEVLLMWIPYVHFGV